MIAVIDSGVANLTSVMAALGRVNAEAIITTDPQAIAQAEKVVLPGVGAAAPAMHNLKDRGLADVIRRLTQPVMGICLGMQILFNKSLEHGGVDCLGLILGNIEPLQALPGQPVPHMGWNTLTLKQKNHPLLHDVHDGDYVYYVHSYAAPVRQATIASTEYGTSFSAMVAYKNFFGCQFHPERSGKVGSQILKNFVDMP